MTLFMVALHVWSLIGSKKGSTRLSLTMGRNDSGAYYREDFFGKEHPDATVLKRRAVACGLVPERN